MARARNIKPGVMANEDLADLEPLTRLLFVYLWMLADREGRFEDRPKRIRAEALPYDAAADVDSMLHDLAEAGFVARYLHDGNGYVQILNFAKHQRPHSNETGSDIPPYDPEVSTMVKRAFDHGTKGGEPSKKALRSDSLIPDSLIEDSLIADCLIPDSGAVAIATVAGTPGKKTPGEPAPRSKAPAKRKDEPPTAATWKAYAGAFRDRYGVVPVRNAKVNAQVSQFVARIGVEEAPHVARYFVGHNASYYVQRGHGLACLVTDAEKLRMEWATRRQTTAATARQIDNTQTNANAFLPLIEEARQREANEARGNHGK